MILGGCDFTVVNIEGYNIVRKDRSSHEHGGVCAYVKHHIKYELPDIKCCDDHEIVWLQLDLTRTPRGFSKLVLAVVYYPGRTSPAESDGPNLLNHLFDSLTRAEALFPNCGFVIVGNFNRLNTAPLQNHFKLKQLVKFPTRGQTMLDLFLTNMYDYFSAPESFPPFGLSDHATVIMKPKIRVPNQHTRKSIIIRDVRESNKASLGRYFAGIDWSCVTDQITCEDQLQVFTDIVVNGLSNIMPERTIKIYPEDAPWLSVKLKKLILMRQHAFHANKCGLAYKFYRNAVNRERKLCRAKYYASKVKNLKGPNPRQWWNEVRKLSGSEKQNSSLLSCLNVPEYSNMTTTADVANDINNALLSPLQDYESISWFTEIVALEEDPVFLELPTH